MKENIERIRSEIAAGIEAVKGGTLYASEHPVIWICGECGYMHTSKEAWKVCPLCGAKQGEVLLHLPYEGI